MVKYTLTYGAIVRELEYLPETWDETTADFARDEKYHGIFRKLNSSMRFVEDGATILQSAFFTDGVEADVSVNIEAYNTLTMAWETIFTGDVDFSTINIGRDFVEAAVIETGLPALIKANEGTEYVIPLPTDTILDYSGIRLYGGEFSNSYALFDAIGSNSFFHSSVNNLLPWAIPQDFGSNNDNTQSAYSTQSVSDSIIQPRLDRYFFTANRACIVDFVFSSSNVTFRTYLDNDDYNGGTSQDTWTFTMYLRVRNSLGVITRENLLANVQITPQPSDLAAGFYVKDLAVGISSNQSGVSLVAGDKVYVEWDWEPADPAQRQPQNRAGIQVTALYVTGDVQAVLPTIEIPTFRVMDLFDEIITRIDPTASTDSDYFGGLPLTEVMMLTSGDAIRGITSPTIKVKLSDFFDSVSAIHGVGMSVADGVARLEKLSYIYNSTIGVPFGEVSELSISAAIDLMPKTLEVGYNTEEYGELNGRDEFNARQQWVFPYTKISNKLDGKSLYRADMYGIDNYRISFYGSTDNDDDKADNEVFIIDAKYTAQVSGIRYYEVSRDKYTYIAGLQSLDTAYNMVYSPRSCLLRNQEKLAAGLWKLTETIDLSSYDKNVNLQYSTGGSIQYESASIQSSSLTGIFAPLYAEFTIDQKTGLWASLAANGRYKCSFVWNGTTYYGYIMDASVNIDHLEVIQVRVILDINNDFSNLI